MLSSVYDGNTGSILADLEVDYQCRGSTQNFGDKGYVYPLEEATSRDPCSL